MLSAADLADFKIFPWQLGSETPGKGGLLWVFPKGNGPKISGIGSPGLGEIWWRHMIRCFIKKKKWKAYELASELCGPKKKQVLKSTILSAVSCCCHLLQPSTLKGMEWWYYLEHLTYPPKKKKRMVGLFDCFEIERKSRNAQKFINDVGVFDARILIFAMNHLLLGVNFAHSTLLYLELFFVADMRSSCVRPTS